MAFQELHVTGIRTASDEARPDRASPSAVGVQATAFVLVLLLAYVLSPGPLALLLKQAGLTGWDLILILSWVYAPLIWVERRVPAFAEFLEWYMELWGH